MCCDVLLYGIILSNNRWNLLIIPTLFLLAFSFNHPSIQFPPLEPNTKWINNQFHANDPEQNSEMFTYSMVPIRTKRDDLVCLLISSLLI
jgi:hypothetical protein